MQLCQRHHHTSIHPLHIFREFKVCVRSLPLHHIHLKPRTPVTLLDADGTLA
jgi:hypothetical protein